MNNVKINNKIKESQKSDGKSKSESESRKKSKSVSKDKSKSLTQSSREQSVKESHPSKLKQSPQKPTKETPQKLKERTETKLQEDREVKQPAVKSTSKSPLKSPVKLQKPADDEKIVKPSETSSEKSSEIFEKPSETLKVELKIERKKSPKRIEKPKVNIFLEDSDEVDEFESIIDAAQVKSKWSSPEVVKNNEEIPQIVPAPITEFKRILPEIPVVIESPEPSPVAQIPLSNNLFESTSLTIEKSPTPSPPPKPAKVRNVCSFLSDIASGNMFSGLGLGSGLYDEDNSIAGLNLENYKAETEVKVPEGKSLNIIKFDVISLMEPDTTAERVEKLQSRNVDSDSDESDSDSSDSSSSDSDDTTSESEVSSEESSDDEVPSFTRGFGRFDASSMPMVTQIKPTTVMPTPVTTTVTTSRFQPQQSVIKPPGLVTNVTKPALYTPAIHQPVMPTVATPFSVGSFPFPIPFKIYSLRDCSMVFPGSVVQPVVTPVPTPVSEKSDKKSTIDRREKERKRSRSHSRERDKKRLKDDRRKSPAPRRRSQSPAKKRHSDDRPRQLDEKKDARIRDPSPRHASHSSRSSYGSR